MPRLYPTKHGNLTIEEYHAYFGSTVEERADYWTFGDNFHADRRRAGWYVFESQTRDPLILIRATTDNCDCPFKRITNITCKHILAVRNHEDPNQTHAHDGNPDTSDSDNEDDEIGSLAEFIVNDSDTASDTDNSDINATNIVESDSEDGQDTGIPRVNMCIRLSSIIPTIL